MSTIQARNQQKPPEVYNFSATEGDKKVLGFSGKIGAGKSTCKNFLMMMAMKYHLHVNGAPILHPDTTINENGKIVVPVSETDWDVVDIDNRHPDVVAFMSEYVWPFMRSFSTAQPLKNICTKIFGIDEKLIFGSQEDKNRSTGVKWEDFPGYIGDKKGYMTGREFMEEFGTGIVRKINPDGWANALGNEILDYGSQHSLVDDIRFKNEARKIQSIGGKVIRLTLTTEEAKKNNHTSNIELDDFDGFDAIIDNQNMTMEESFIELIHILMDWGWFKVVNQ